MSVFVNDYRFFFPSNEMHFKRPKKVNTTATIPAKLNEKKNALMRKKKKNVNIYIN